MRTLPRTFYAAGMAVTTALAGCGSTPITGTFTLPTYKLTVSPQPDSVPVGGKVTFTATTDAPSLSWVLVGITGTSSTPGVDAGSPATQSGGSTFAYTAPAVPPVYPTGIESAGTVVLRTIAGGTTVETRFIITAPVTTGFLTPSSTSVALGGTLVINAYASGSPNQALFMQVNGVTGGSTATGTIVAPPSGIYGEYIYTAPATMPMTGSTITITAISQADPTKSSNLTLTLH